MSESTLPTIGERVAALCEERDGEYKRQTKDIFNYLQDHTEFLDAVIQTIRARAESITWIDTSIYDGLIDEDPDEEVIVVSLTADYGVVSKVPEIIKLLTPATTKATRFVKIGIPVSELSSPKQELVDMIGQTIISMAEAGDFDDIDGDFYDVPAEYAEELESTVEFVGEAVALDDEQAASLAYLTSIAQKGRIN